MLHWQRYILYLNSAFGFGDGFSMVCKYFYLQFSGWEKRVLLKHMLPKSFTENATPFTYGPALLT
jgi:hypothetical protein